MQKCYLNTVLFKRLDLKWQSILDMQSFVVIAILLAMQEIVLAKCISESCLGIKAWKKLCFDEDTS